MGEPRRPASNRKWTGPWFTSAVLVLFALGIAGSTLRITPAAPPAPTTADRTTQGGANQEPTPSDWQVTVIGMQVLPGEADGGMDPRLASIKNQLRKLIPANHGVKLLDVRSDRISAGKTIRCDLGKDRRVKVTLVDPLGMEGKIKLHYELTEGKKRLAASDVSSPLNQLFFCEHKLEDGSMLLIGVGAR